MNSLSYVSSLYRRKEKQEPDFTVKEIMVSASENQSPQVGVLPNKTFADHIYSVLVFVPKYTIYYPLYYVKCILSLTMAYPFRLVVMLLHCFFIQEENDEFSDQHFSETGIENDRGEEEPSRVNGDDGCDESLLEELQKNVQEQQPLASAKGRYTSQYTIPTIVEEDMGLENDDYFKSPLDSNPKEAKSSDTDKLLLQKKKTRRKKKFVFPKLLFDFDINNPPQLPRKTLVLDLDETLIHSLSRYNSSTYSKKGRAIEVKVKGSIPTLYHIYKRPYVEEFLSVVYQWFDLVCFTASIKEYADPVIDYLEEQVLAKDMLKKSIKRSKMEMPTRIFSKRFYRDSCIFVDGKGYIKDLSVLVKSGRMRSSSLSSNVSGRSTSKGISKEKDYSKVIIIDNSPISYVKHQDNGLMIEGWINDPDDTELMNLLPLLHSLRFVSDVRCILGLKSGQQAFRQ